MNPFFIALLVFTCVFGAGMMALLLRSRLPQHHLSVETKDTVRLIMGLVSTMAALVLGLLIASSKGTYDTQKSELTLMASKIAFVDRLLESYGPESTTARQLFRDGIGQMVERLWPRTTSDKPLTDPRAVSGEAVYHAIQKLSPQNDEQRDLKTNALAVAYEIGQLRWLLFTQTNSSISTPLLLIVVCWLALLFLSFGLFAPSNNLVTVFLLVAALSVAGAIFLILELDQPFGGLIQISSQSMVTILNQLGQ